MAFYSFVEDVSTNINNINKIQQQLTFVGSFNSKAEFPLQANEGDLVLNTENNCEYVYADHRWILIGGYEIGSIDHSEEYIPQTDSGVLIDRKCENCGAPLRMVSKFKFHCDYCGSEFQSLNYL